ncbi:MAG: helix-turn-helix transcriptional regulator [Steroidobacteraceae bacterium]
MRADVARRLKSRGWKVGDATELLGLSDQEAALVELRLALSRSVRERRLKLGLSQLDLASRLGSSQSRVAKLEGADATVSIDLLVRGLLALGATRREIGRALAE